MTATSTPEPVAELVSRLLANLEHVRKYLACGGQRTEAATVAEAASTIADLQSRLVAAEAKVVEETAKVDLADKLLRGQADRIATLTAERDAATALASKARGAALEEARDAQPITAADPDESSYQRGYFDGVMAYAAAIQAIAGDAE